MRRLIPRTSTVDEHADETIAILGLAPERPEQYIEDTDDAGWGDTPTAA